jgi:hypothetical protein
MRKLFAGLWLHEDYGRFAGLRLRRRMTVVRLTGGELWVHSPTPLTSILRSEVAKIGEVAFLVAPNNFHHSWISEWHDAYPDAAVHLAGGVPKKLQNGLAGKTIEAGSALWNEDLDHVVISGVPLFDESVFLHRRTHSLVVSDLLQNHNRDDQRGLGRFVAKYVSERQGYRGLCLPPQLRRPGTIEDRMAFDESIKTLLSWRFDRVIVAHGDVVTNRPREELANLFGRIGRLTA